MPKPYKKMPFDEFEKFAEEKIKPWLKDYYDAPEGEDPPQFFDKYNNEISFGYTENVNCTESIGKCYGMGELLGCQEITPIQFPFLGVFAGSDDNIPLFFILYPTEDGFAGYVPTDGNVWNTDEMCSYGPDDEDDYDNIIKRYPGIGFEDMDRDVDQSWTCLDTLFIPQSTFLEIAREFKGNSTTDKKIKDYSVHLYPTREIVFNFIQAENPEQAARQAFKMDEAARQVFDNTPNPIDIEIRVKPTEGGEAILFDRDFKKYAKSRFPWI